MPPTATSKAVRSPPEPGRHDLSAPVAALAAAISHRRQASLPRRDSVEPFGPHLSRRRRAEGPSFADSFCPPPPPLPSPPPAAPHVAATASAAASPAADTSLPALVAQGVREHFEVFLESFSSEPASAHDTSSTAGGMALDYMEQVRPPALAAGTRPRSPSRLTRPAPPRSASR